MVQLNYGPGPGAIVQVAFVVDDIQKQMIEWTETLRVGPFFHLPHFPLVDAQYRGEPIALDIDVALAFSGGMCFELIQQHGDYPSPFRDGTCGARLGFHHVARPTRAFDDDVARYERDGMKCVASARVAMGGRVAYLETPSLPGMLELIEMSPATEQLFAMIQAASQGWDGSDPIRKLGP
jgi:Glyoxalase/Bleomycin resistance protein/Dioxygenase superfamily